MKNLLYIFILAFFFSCTKKCNIHITAKNAVTGKPYPDLHYEVIREHTGMWEEKYKKVASGILDENGEAMVSKNIIKDPIRIMVERPPNWCYEKNNQFYLKGDGPNYEVNIEFAECAYLKLSIHNANYQGPNDYFKLYYMGRQVGGQGDNIVGAIIKEGGGDYSYVQNDFSSVPIGGRYYQWEVTRNSITNTYYDTINLAENEYKTYTINY